MSLRKMVHSDPNQLQRSLDVPSGEDPAWRAKSHYSPWEGRSKAWLHCSIIEDTQQILVMSMDADFFNTKVCGFVA